MLFVPQAAIRLATFLRRNNAYDQEGIFRIAPSQELLRGALANFALCTSRSRVLGEDAAFETFPEFLDFELPDSMPNERYALNNVVASCYKVFFRFMSKRVFPDDVFSEIREMGAVTSDGLRDKLPSLLLKIPAPHRFLLRHTLKQLAAVVERTEDNRMTSSNVARIFSTGIFQEPDCLQNLGDAQYDNDLQIRVTKILIDEQQHIFDEVDALVAKSLAQNPRVQLCPDELLSDCCQDENRWRFYFPEDTHVLNRYAGACDPS